MEYNRGIFGVLNQDDMEEQPLVLLDGGVERRCGEAYDFIMTAGRGTKAFFSSTRFWGRVCMRKTGSGTP